MREKKLKGEMDGAANSAVIGLAHPAHVPKPVYVKTGTQAATDALHRPRCDVRLYKDNILRVLGFFCFVRLLDAANGDHGARKNPVN